MNIFNAFNSGLKKTSIALSENLSNLLLSKKIDQNLLDEIENILLSSDIGIESTNYLIKKLKSNKVNNLKDVNSILNILAVELEQILLPREKSLFKSNDNTPTLLLFIGVNGSGKTTTIGKLTNHVFKNKKILITACDTFRAAAVDQLKQWAIDQHIDFFEGKFEQDPASVAFEACQKAKDDNYDYVLIDTAGRLSNNVNLLNQLIKIKSVIEKKINKESIKTILVLDGTNGSNMVKQVEVFSKSININGLIITKIDGTAKGGALISIAKKYEIPIYYVGLGEKIDDLFKFNAKIFSKSMLSRD